jgi:hypothetical protein
LKLNFNFNTKNLLGYSMARPNFPALCRLLLLIAGLAMAAHAQDASSVNGQASPGAAPEPPQPQVSQPQAPAETQPEAGQTQTWNFHMQTTTTVQGYPSF